MCVTLTPAAASFMARMVRFGQGGVGAGFRLSVRPGGCSGFETSFTIEGAPLPGDAVIEQHGARLFLTEASCELLRGYTVDFSDYRRDSGLIFTHPDAPQACGCGGGEPANKTSVVFLHPAGCVKKPAA